MFSYPNEFKDTHRGQDCNLSVLSKEKETHSANKETFDWTKKEYLQKQEKHAISLK